MPEEATTAAPAETPPSETPVEASPEASTSPAPSLGQELVDLMAKAQSQAPEKGAPDPNHFQKVNTDHSREIGESRTKITEMQAEIDALKSSPQTAQEEGTERLFKDPEGFLRDRDTKIVEQVKKDFEEKYGQTLTDARNQTVATQVANESPISSKLLYHPETQAWLSELSQDPQATARYSNTEKNQLKAVMYDRMTGLMSAQETAHANAPPVERPENSGLPTPASTPASAPPTSGLPSPEEVQKKGMQWGFEEWAKRMAPLVK